MADQKTTSIWDDQATTPPTSDPSRIPGAAPASIWSDGPDPLETSLNAARPQKPDTAARVLQLQMKTGLPPVVIERNLEEVESKAAATDFNAATFRASYPGLATWLQEPKNAAIAHDDLEQLGLVSQILERPKNLVRRFSAGVNVGISGAFGALEFLAKNQAPEIAPFVMEGPARDAEREHAVTFFKEMRQEVTKTADYARGDQSGAGLLERGIYSGVESVGMMAPALMASVLTGTPGPMLAIMGVETGGASYGKAIDQGYSHGRAATYGAIDATIEVATEYIPAKWFLADLAKNAGLGRIVAHQLAGEVPGELVATTLQNLNEWATLNPDKPFSTYLEELPDALAETVIATVTSVAFMGAVGKVATSLSGDGGRAKQAEIDKTFFEELAKGVKGSATVERMKPAAQELFAQLTAGGPVEHVYIPVDVFATYFQDKEIDTATGKAVGAEAIAAALTGQAGSLARAQKTGEDLEISTAIYATEIAASPHHSALVDDLRLGSPARMTAKESAAYREAQAAVAAEAPSDAPEAVNPIRQAVLQKLQAGLAGSKVKLPRRALERYADLFAALVPTVAERENLDPVDVLRRYGLAVEDATTQPRPPTRVEQLEEELRSVRRAAEVDSLTGVANRAAMDRALPAAELDAGTHVIAFDANNFGQVNKIAGHEAGDAMLKQMAEAIKAAAVEAGVGERVFRRGGDEFVVLAPAKVAKQVSARAAELFGSQELTAEDGATVAVSLTGTAGATFADADRVLQSAKRATKAGIVDRKADTAQTTEEPTDAATEPLPNRLADQKGRSARHGIAPSDPGNNTEQAERHLERVFNALLGSAQAITADVNVAELRAEFDYRLELYLEAYRLKAGDANQSHDLLRAIVKIGGIAETSQTSGELRELRGKFGTVIGVPSIPGVFRTKRIGRTGNQQTSGHDLDVVLQSLHSGYPEFAWIENIDMLVDQLDELSRHSASTMSMTELPGTEELREVNIREELAWWEDPWRNTAAEEPDENPDDMTADAINGDTDFTFNQGARVDRDAQIAQMSEDEATAAASEGTHYFDSLYRSGEPRTKHPFLARSLMGLDMLGSGGTPTAYHGVLFSNPLVAASRAEASEQLLGENIYPGVKVPVGEVSDASRAILAADERVGAAAEAAGYDAIVTPEEIQVIDPSVLPPREAVIAGEYGYLTADDQDLYEGIGRDRAGARAAKAATPTATARYLGEQEDGLGGSMSLYNITGGPSNGSTVGAEQLTKLGIDVPPIDTLDTGEAQPRLFADPSQTATAPLAELPFTLTAEIRKEKDYQRTLFQDPTPPQNFATWFGGSKVVDEDGQPLVVYHGTTGVFDTFDQSRGNIESDFGAGIYFSNNAEDVGANYAGMGPDLKSKIERRAERIQDQYADNDGQPDDEPGPTVQRVIELLAEKGLTLETSTAPARETAFKAIAAEQFGVEHGGATMPVFLKIENPAIVGGDNDTVLTFEQEFAPLSDFQDEDIAELREQGMDDDEIRRELSDRNYYEPEEKGSLIEFIEALRMEARQFNDGGVDEDGLADVINSILEQAGFESISLSRVIEILKQDENFGYFTDDEGNLASHEITRRALKRTGFDGIIDYTVDIKFGSQRRLGSAMAGMDADTVHYIVFEPTQIKSASGNVGTYDPRNPSILFQPFFHGSPHSFDTFSTEKIGTGEGAQSYGWGLYFAENPAVAKDYQRSLSDTSSHARFTAKGVLLDENTPEKHGAALISFNNTREIRNTAMRWLEEASDPNNLGMADTAAKAGLDTYEYWRRLAEFVTTHGKRDIKVERGHVYQVEIPDARVAEMLNWDAPLSQQPPAVQAFAKKLITASGYSRVRDINLGKDPTGEAIYREIEAYVEDRWKRAGGGVSGLITGPEGASRALAAAGVPGLRYYDEGSRPQNIVDQRLERLVQENAGNVEAAVDALGGSVFLPPAEKAKWRKSMIEFYKKKTRNVVVFDESIVKVTHRDGTPLTPQEREEYFQEDKEETVTPASPRGSITGPFDRNAFFGPDLEFTIKLFENADVSTFLHESGHLFLKIMQDLEARPEASAGLKRDLAIIREQFGADSVGQHERFARSFEAYLLEGRAPSLSLRSVFDDFRGWLLRLYKTMAGLNVQLTDDVRGVFDRMLASDAAIAEAQAAVSTTPMFVTAEEARMSPSEFDLYRQKIAAASRKGRKDLEEKLLKDLQRQQTQAYRDEKNEIRKQVTAEVHAMPIYQALAAIRKGTQPDGSPLVEGAPVSALKLSKHIIIEKFGGAARLTSLPKPAVYTADDGMDPDMVAPLFGFSSGDALLDAIAAAPPMNGLISAETTKRAKSQLGDLVLDNQLSDLARAAVANEHREEIVRIELETLSRLRRTAQAGAVKERDYERRWFEAEAKLRIAIAEGRTQAKADAEKKTLTAEAKAKLLELRERKDLEITRLAADVREMKALARGGPSMINAAIPSEADLKQIALDRIGRTRIRDLKPDTFFTAARQASQKALEAAARQDFAEAISAKQQEQIALALYREASAAKADAETRVKAAQALDSPASRRRIGLAGKSYQDQIDAILDRYDFAKITGKALDKREALRMWISQLEADGFSVDLPDDLVDDARRVHYRELTVEQLAGVTDGLKSIVRLASLKLRLLKNRDQRAYAVVRNGLVTSIRDNSPLAPTPLEFRKTDDRNRTIAEWFASHARLATLGQVMDGAKEGGAFWSAINRPINDAASAKERRNADEGKAYAAILEQYYPGRELGRMGELLHIPEIKGSLSREARISVALNWGNQTSRDRLLNDPKRKWNEKQIKAILDTLSANDLKFVQATFDFLERFWPEIAAKSERLTGVAPEKVLPTSIATKAGTIPGGYYPLAYDSRLNLKGQQQEEAQSAKLKISAAYVQSTTRRGHLITRKQNVKRSAKLELGVVFSHLEQVIHDLTHHEMLIDVTRLLRDPQVQDAILETKGDLVYQQFTRGLEAIAAGQLDPAKNGVEKAATWMRTGSQVALLGYNLWTGALQPLGLFNGAQRVGGRWVARGMKRWLVDAAHMQATTTWIHDVSPFMASRSANATQDLSDLRAAFRTGGGWFDTAVRTVTREVVTQQHIIDSFLWHIGLMQRVADVPTWLGQFEKSMAGGETEARAIALADQAVIDSQGSGRISDLSQVQRGGPIARLFLTFYSYGATTYNATYMAAGKTNFKSASDVTKFLGHLSLIYVMPAAAAVAISRAVGRTGDDDDDWTDYLEDVGQESLAAALNTMMWVREASQIAADGTRGYAGPAGARAIQLVYQLGGQVKQGVADAALGRAMLAAGGILFRFPAAQAQRTIDGWVALEEGRTENPLALLFGPPR